jgi:hypothetical protein
MSTINPNSAPILLRGSTVAQPDRKKVNIGAILTPEIQRLYSIFLYDLVRRQVFTTTASLDPASRTNKAEFFFNTPPKSLDMTEPYATRVIATQNGGKFIESHGSIFKEIRLTGTTGLRPRKKAPTVIPLLPTGSFETLAGAFTGAGFGNQIREIPEEEVTGFDDIHFLRNIFRRYSDSKGQNERLIMVWRNIKDDDYWVVEPRDFKLIMNAQSPLTYNYQLNLQGLSKFDPAAATVEAVDDPLELMRDIGRFFSRIQEYKQALLSSFLVISTQIKRITGAGHFAVNNTIGTLTAVIQGLTAVTTATSSVHKNLVNVTKRGIDEFKKAIADLGDSLQPATVASGTFGRSGVERRDPIIHSLLRGLVVFYKILNEATLQDNVSNEESEIRGRISDSYRITGDLTGAPQSPRTGGSPTFVGNSTSPATIAEATVGEGETIRDLAKRLLGDFRRWHELVLLNDLRAPYTSDGALTPGVLAPGDSILYASSNANIDPLHVNTINLSPDETEQQDQNVEGILSQTYGRDLRLRSVVSGNNIDVTDLSVNQRGDLSTIVGIPNVDQALRIKFATEQGELVAHPTFGSRFPIGSKADVASFNEFRLNTLSTLQSDPRIREIVKLNFQAVQDILTVEAKLLLQDSREYLNTNFALRRF